MQALTSGFRNPSLLESVYREAATTGSDFEKSPRVRCFSRLPRDNVPPEGCAAIGLACACQYLAATRFHGRHARVEATAMVEADLEEHAKGAANLFSLSWA